MKVKDKVKGKGMVKGILTLTLTLALCVQAKVIVDISSSPVVQVRTATVAGEAVSLLPPDKKWKLVWHDEFNGPEIDRLCRWRITPH